MDKLPLISIIVPVYNADAYLDEAVRSVLSQTHRSLELILIDDGSTDSSGALCDRWSLKESRVRTLHQNNRGTAAARNTGIDHASGEYLGFIDADDWIEQDMIALLLANSVAYDADISACGFLKTPLRIHEAKGPDFAPSTVYTPAEALRSVFRPDQMRYSACNKLFRRRLFEELRFPEGSVLEDKALICRLIHKSGRVAWCPLTKYHYFQRPGSIMHEDPLKWSMDLFQVNENLMDFIAEQYPKFLPVVQASYAMECYRLLQRIEGSGTEAVALRRRCISILRKYWIPAATVPDADWHARFNMLIHAALPLPLKNR